jgi:PPK2 family polyphosphate:nucleotide phosphotransferase
VSLLKKIDGSKKIRLSEIDPDSTKGITREEADTRLASLQEEISELHDLLYAAQETPMLIVLQGMDTAGKDGTVRHVIGALNPMSCRVSGFKVPTPTEQAHDFLWRIHQEAPMRGQVAVFNRSHYEDVLVVRVHKLVPEPVWKRRYKDINNFEELLVDNGTIILKFFLHISKEEQHARLLDREKDPTKAWKLSAGDWKERELWDDYQEAYEDAINRCATPESPWFIVPANKKWYRNVAISEAIVEAMRPHKAKWLKRLEEVGDAELKELRAMRRV